MNRKDSTGKPLSAREKVFVDEFLIELKPEESARKAGYAESTCKSQAYTWIKENKCPPNKRHVFNAIQVEKEKRSNETKINASYVLKRLHEIDQMDVLDILADDGSVLPISEWPKAWRTTISGFDVSELFEGVGDQRKMIGLLKKIKWPDKTKNLELLGRHVEVQAFREKLEVEVVDKRDALAAARKRAHEGKNKTE